MRHKEKALFPSLFLGLLLVATWLCYAPGLDGGFLFDDYPNLEPLGAFGGVTDWESFKSFVFSGVSGPTGRPLALATFLLDDNTWPSYGAWFKATNLKIHLLVGLLLAWASLLLMRLLKKDEEQAVWISLISCALWMLHPYMASTTLYIVQRMAQLAAMFMFIGLVGYFYGRLMLEKNRPLAGYLWMSISLVVCTLLSSLCKENGILLPVGVLVIEFCISPKLAKLNFWWISIFLWGPTLILIIYLLSKVDFTSENMTGRPFSQIERIMSQFRIMWEYLFNLFIPKIEGRGLFQDGYVVSKSLFHPVTTFTSIAGMFLLVSSCVVFRYRFPLFSLSILFFLSGHLLESTWLNLELYFEHRNYAPAAFLFLPIAAGMVALFKLIDFRLAFFCTFLILLLIGFLTIERSRLWSSTDRLEIYWAAMNPDSARAQNRVGTLLLQMDRVDESIKYLEDADNKFQNSSLLTINTLLVKVYANVANENDFLIAGDRMRSQPFDAQAVKGLRNLVEKIVAKESDEYAGYALVLIKTVKQNGHYSELPIFNRLYHYLNGMLYLRLQQFDNALASYLEAMNLYSETDAALSMVADMGNAARPGEALIMLDRARQIYDAQPDSSLIRSRSIYNAEFEKMDKVLRMARDSLETGGRSSGEAQ